MFFFKIDNISNNDLDIQAAISIERINNNRMRNNFEKYADFLLPVCPYSKELTTNNNNTRNTKIYEVNLKCKDQNKTGVDIFWHTKK